MPLSAELRPLSAVGERVRVDTVVETDVPAYRRAVETSRERIRPWNPVNPDDLAFHLRRQSDEHRTFLVRALPHVRVRGHDIVGKVNLTGIQRGRAFSGVLGYDAYDPYAGKGLFAEGLRLVVDVAFAPMPHGLGLNRVEAAVQPGNVRSAGLLRSLGFRRRGAYPRYLWLADAEGRDAWRDHVVYGVDRYDWPAEPYDRDDVAGPVVVVEAGAGEPGPRDVAAARALAAEMGVPVLRPTGPATGRPDAAWAERLADAATGAVVLVGRGGGVPSTGAPWAHTAVTTADLDGPSAVTRVALDAHRLAHATRR
ncbi:GNAT family N-acetyltransferase [Mobilicoccus pelagius]|uniref:N-acetyltransferase domain-containing protein n=1 Tax=Mobilicoccus pelagius NBRC 104925 TaxID=1089455 RepID=H5UNB6_9MICO|nr:GNAT family protein [Mobilicoccus pelagius]GAB47224.1 hypothetical protein MOPEL_007_00410 [Mobilicoccus pelagius NBRC 104925]